MASQQLNTALARWLWAQQNHPDIIARYQKDHYDHPNPFVPWPPNDSEIEKFTQYFAHEMYGDDRGKETNINKQINPEKLNELVAEFDHEYKEIKAGKVEATERAHAYVDEIKKKAKKERAAAEQAGLGPKFTNQPPEETPAISDEPRVRGGAEHKTSEDRLSQVIAATLENPTDRKSELLKTLILVEQNSPKETPIVELVPRAIEAGEVAYNLASGVPAEPVIKLGFADIAHTPLQRLAAPALDAIGAVFPAAKSEAMTTIIGQQMKKVLDDTALLTEKFGRIETNSLWYQQALGDANRFAGDKGGMKGAVSGATNLLTSLGSAVFTAPPPAEYIAVMELYHTNVMQGLPPPTAYQVYAASAGIGTGNQSPFGFGYGMFQMGSGLAVQAGAKKVAGMAAAKIGLTAGMTAALGPVGTVVATTVGDKVIGKVMGAVGGFLNATIGGGFISRLLTGDGEAPGSDGLIMAVLGGVVLLFLGVGIMVSPLFSLPGFGQEMINTSLASNFQGGLGNEPAIDPFAFSSSAGNIMACFESHSITISGETTRAFTSTEFSHLQSVTQKYPQLGCIATVLSCPAQKINLSAYRFASPQGYGAFAPSGARGNIIYYPSFFNYSDYYYARTIAHEMAHEINWFHTDIYDAYINGSSKYPRGYCGPLGTYKFGENSHETFAEAVALFMVNPGDLQARCQRSYDFMTRLFNQCRR